MARRFRRFGENQWLVDNPSRPIPASMIRPSHDVFVSSSAFRFAMIFLAIASETPGT